MPKIGKKYETPLIRRLTSLQEELNAAKLSEKEFNILIGLLLKTEINKLVHHQVQHHLNPEDDRKMTFIGYAGNRRYTHA